MRGTTPGSKKRVRIDQVKFFEEGGGENEMLLRQRVQEKQPESAPVSVLAHALVNVPSPVISPEIQRVIDFAAKRKLLKERIEVLEKECLTGRPLLLKTGVVCTPKPKNKSLSKAEIRALGGVSELLSLPSVMRGQLNNWLRSPHKKSHAARRAAKLVRPVLTAQLPPQSPASDPASAPVVAVVPLFTGQELRVERVKEDQAQEIWISKHAAGARLSIATPATIPKFNNKVKEVENLLGQKFSRDHNQYRFLVAIAGRYPGISASTIRHNLSLEKSHPSADGRSGLRLSVVSPAPALAPAPASAPSTFWSRNKARIAGGVISAGLMITGILAIVATAGIAAPVLVAFGVLAKMMVAHAAVTYAVAGTATAGGAAIGVFAGIKNIFSSSAPSRGVPSTSSTSVAPSP